jgi:hypothetical protein
VILLAIFCLLKLRNRRLWVRLGKSNTALHDVTSNFERNSGIALTAVENSRGTAMQIDGQSTELVIRHRLEQVPDAANSV